MSNDVSSDELTDVVKGPNGEAEIFEVIEVVNGNDVLRSEVRFNGQRQAFRTLGEAYIEAGNLVGTRT